MTITLLEKAAIDNGFDRELPRVRDGRTRERARVTLMSNQPRSFTIASYNVLADAFITPSWYPVAEPDVLRATCRHAARVEHDRVPTTGCLQETHTPATT